ncbi:MAG: hypothetical protein ACI4R9_01960 [Kiritimatiellia bacterium]
MDQRDRTEQSVQIVLGCRVSRWLQPILGSLGFAWRPLLVISNQHTSVSNSASSVPPCEAFSPVFDADGNRILVKTATRVWSVSYKTLMEGIQKGIGRIAGRISDMEYEFFLNTDCCDFGKVARSAGFLKPVKEALNRSKEHDNPTKGVK